MRVEARCHLRVGPRVAEGLRVWRVARGPDRHRVGAADGLTVRRHRLPVGVGVRHRLALCPLKAHLLGHAGDHLVRSGDARQEALGARDDVDGLVGEVRLNVEGDLAATS